MQKGQLLAGAIAIGVVGALFFWGNTKPPQKNTPAPTAATAEAGHAHDVAEAITFEELLASAKAKLSAEQNTTLTGIEQQVKRGDVQDQQMHTYHALARKWEDFKDFPVAAYYHAEAAKLENSEKTLTFAGNLFLTLLSKTEDVRVRKWEALQAIDCFQKAIDLNPDNDTLQIALASCYIEGTGETMQGVQLLLGVTRSNPDNVPANLILGRMAVQSGQFDKAIKRLEELVSKHPDNSEAMYFLAEAYKGQGQTDKAVEWFEKCKKKVNNPEFSKEIDNYIATFKH